ncbi:hypothetical protein IMZ48_09610 [Candidatus Bathyarchaeota archaeon]|nr:hypothetical protein [Candidatus Bathyarchaeota archaeon]
MESLVNDEANDRCATAFRDRNAGVDRNRSKETEEGTRGGGRGGYGARVRGGKSTDTPSTRGARPFLTATPCSTGRQLTRTRARLSPPP